MEESSLERIAVDVGGHLRLDLAVWILANSFESFFSLLLGYQVLHLDFDLGRQYLLFSFLEPGTPLPFRSRFLP